MEIQFTHFQREERKKREGQATVFVVVDVTASRSRSLVTQ
jgi:hypothetical protein